jgi:oxaloacetate decarboxylase beta subunit
MDFFGTLGQFITNTGIWNLDGHQFLMVLIGLLLVLVAVARRQDTLLLVALGFGIIVGNMPASPIEQKLVADNDGFSMLTLFAGMVRPEILPSLIFLGIGALTDFGTLIANPRLAILGGGAQMGIFLAVVLATMSGLDLHRAAALATVGGAHSPLAIFAASTLDPERLGAIAIMSYICMMLAPVIVTPIVRLLTTPRERRIRMAPPRTVSRKMRILFPVAGFIICMLFVPTTRGVLGMLFLGNLLRESGATERISKTIGRTFTDIVTVLLAFGVGVVTPGAHFISWATLGVFVIGLMSFAMSVAWGILFARIMNLFAKKKINPMIGAAGVTHAPVAARVVARLASEEDPENQLLRQAMVPNLAGVIALALTIGVFLMLLPNS